MARSASQGGSGSPKVGDVITVRVIDVPREQERQDDTAPLPPSGGGAAPEVQRSEALSKSAERDGEPAAREDHLTRGGGGPEAVDSALPTWITKYLAANERPRLVIQPHIATIGGSGLLTLTVLIVALLVSPRNFQNDLSDVVWYLFWWLAVRLAWNAYFWYRDRIVITDERIFRVSGIFTRVAGSMPLNKLTDYEYRRTLTGYALGYGTFLVESAGQDQALSRIDYVPQPDRVYQIVNTLVFREQ